MAFSCSIMPTPDCPAISFRVEARPPRVGSRKQRTSAPVASTADTSVCSAAVSDWITASNDRFSRWLMIATPWSPIVPETKIASPARTRAPPSSTPSGNTPTPVVVMKMPSPLPRSTTLVSPVTTGTPAALAACAIDSTIRARSPNAKPSSRIKPAARYSGVAPITATSLSVPCTDRQPISPPGKNSGDTTWQSVDITSRAGLPSITGAGSTAPSLPWPR